MKVSDFKPSTFISSSRCLFFTRSLCSAMFLVVQIACTFLHLSLGYWPLTYQALLCQGSEVTTFLSVQKLTFKNKISPCFQFPHMCRYLMEERVICVFIQDTLLSTTKDCMCSAKLIPLFPRVITTIFLYKSSMKHF